MTTPETFNERIVTTVAEALGWTVTRIKATQDPTFAPDSYRPALLLKRGEVQFITFLDEIEGDPDQVRDDMHFVLRQMARHFQDSPATARPDEPTP